MKKFLMIAAFLVICSAHSQSFCAPNGVTTNPTSPVNPQQPTYLNNFNWTTSNQFYPINSTCIPNAFTLNPFESNQAEMLNLSIPKDMKPVDGWEMIAYNMGFDNNNVLLQATPEHTYIMLYNKYTGIVRIIVKWCRNSNYNGAQLTLKFAPGFQTNILDMSTGEKALNTPHVKNPSISTALKFYNDNNSWGYADFKLNYDPCTCSFSENSRLFLYSELITNSSVVLTGKINGTITTITNGQGNATSNGNFWKTATSINSAASQVHSGVQSFMQNYQTIYQNLADSGVTINAINSLGTFLNNNSFIKSGLKAFPYVSAGVKFLSGLFGGGASGDGPISLAPLSVNLDVNISGNITTQDPMHNQTIGLPGSIHNNILPGTVGGQPLYNETLGVFALLSNPVMYYTESTTRTSFLNRESFGSFSSPEYWEFTNDYDFKQRNYKLSGEQLKYVINPASHLQLQDAEFMLMVEYEKPSLKYGVLYPSPKVVGVNMDTANGLPITGTDTGPSVNLGEFIFQNAYKPIGANNFKNNYSFSFLNTVTPVTTSGKKRRLSYNQFATFDKWRCYVGNGTFPSTCAWQSTSVRPFSYQQTNATLPVSWTSLSTFDFKSNSNISVSNPSLVTPRQEFLNPVIKGFKLKMVLNLKRLDDPDAQNVLYVVTYPVDLKVAPAGYNMSGSNYITDAQTYAAQPNYNPASPTNIFVQATQSEITALCTSTAYKTNRVGTTQYRMADDPDAIGSDKTIMKPILFPNPAKQFITVTKNDCEIINVSDIYGSTVLGINSKNSKGLLAENENEITIDVSSLKKGLYFLRYKDINGLDSVIKFVIE
ncbi:T9SS type A sorting domain-containing protein [Flavobacterium sp.]|uniref:T9SS type A sorting domain-containing protein n=1 Tax=Flavobacterium sp. TaxID=239 RepID=UPI00260C3033|nr:T9SS type A sorting domain-containing protein [Flavobacterium sp.]